MPGAGRNPGGRGRRHREQLCFRGQGRPVASPGAEGAGGGGDAGRKACDSVKYDRERHGSAVF